MYGPLCHDGPCPLPAPSRSIRRSRRTRSRSSPKPWVTIVWNDPVNLMSYVAFVFQKYFGYAKAKADS